MLYMFLNTFFPRWMDQKVCNEFGLSSPETACVDRKKTMMRAAAAPGPGFSVGSMSV